MQDAHILCEVVCPVCGGIKKPSDIEFLNVCYECKDGSISSWAFVTRCCRAIIVKANSFDGVVKLLANTNNGKSLRIKSIVLPPVPIEVIEVKNPVPN